MAISCCVINLISPPSGCCCEYFELIYLPGSANQIHWYWLESNLMNTYLVLASRLLIGLLENIDYWIYYLFRLTDTTDQFISHSHTKKRSDCTLSSLWTPWSVVTPTLWCRLWGPLACNASFSARATLFKNDLWKKCKIFYIYQISIFMCESILALEGLNIKNISLEK